MGTICSTTRSIRVRENKGGPEGCERTPPRNFQYKGATSYTHRYTSIHTKQEENSLMVANTYALANLQTEMKESEEQHFIVTVDEPTKILPTQETEITEEQPESHKIAVSNSSPNEDPPETTESIDSEIEIISVQLPKITDAQPESLENAVINTSTNERLIDTPDTTESIDNQTETIAIEQLIKSEITELDFPDSIISTELASTPIDTNKCQLIEEPNLNITTGDTEYNEDCITKSPASTNAFDNTLDIVTHANSTVGNETIENTDKPNSTVGNETIEPTDKVNSILVDNETIENMDKENSPIGNETTEDPKPNTTLGNETIENTDKASYTVVETIENPKPSSTVGNETIENPESIEYTHNPNSPLDESTQGLESDLTNVTRELDEAATDIVDSVLNNNIFITPNITDENPGDIQEIRSIDRDGENDI